MFVEHVAHSGCYQKQNTNDDDGNCGLEALLCKSRERVLGQKGVTAASSRGQGDGETASAAQSVTKDRQFAVFCNGRGAFSSAWLNAARKA